MRRLGGPLGFARCSSPHQCVEEESKVLLKGYFQCSRCVCQFSSQEREHQQKRIIPIKQVGKRSSCLVQHNMVPKSFSHLPVPSWYIGPVYNTRVAAQLGRERGYIFWK